MATIVISLLISGMSMLGVRRIISNRRARQEAQTMINQYDHLQDLFDINEEKKNLNLSNCNFDLLEHKDSKDDKDENKDSRGEDNKKRIARINIKVMIIRAIRVRIKRIMVRIINVRIKRIMVRIK